MGNISVKNSIVVSADIDTAYENFNNPDIIMQWITNKPEYRGYEAPLKAGDTYELIGKFMGQEIASSVTVLEVDAPNLLRFTTEGVINATVNHICESVKGGTKVTIDFEGEMGGFLGNLAAPLAKGAISNQMKNDLKSFKKFIES